ncbi:hypothetical protein ACFSJY_12280 [Thalassotalea euphylliae]|uniref:hypothetical protein n=1 Tax=Thalassotalea euphylliae TaxID=1655234 RepID=UPI003640DCBB
MSVGGLFLALTDSTAKTQRVHQISAEHAAQSKALASRLYRTIKSTNSSPTIFLTQKEIDGLTALAHRAISRLSIDVKLTEHGVVIQSSVDLPLPISRYVNIVGTVLPSESGIELSAIDIGDVSISGERALSWLTMALDLYVGEGTGQSLLSSFSSIKPTKQYVVANLNVDTNLLDKATSTGLLSKIRGEFGLAKDEEQVAQNYEWLVEFAQTQRSDADISLFVRHLFQQNVALQRAPSLEHSYVEQNKAILAALILYFGSDRFGMITPKPRSMTLAEHLTRNNQKHLVTLGGRNDLMKHFVYSVALQLLSNNATSDALGEFKEFLDTNQGGSGFSFADLMADRAGTRMAMIATHSEAQAKQVQPLLARVSDGDLLPTIEGLAEGVNQREFSTTYGDIESRQYQQMVQTIDSRLKSLPLYQFAWR